MVKIIETNISMSGEDKLIDNQSRVIEMDSWNEYVENIKNSRGVNKQCTLGELYGMTLPHNCKVTELNFTDRNVKLKHIIIIKLLKQHF